MRPAQIDADHLNVASPIAIVSSAISIITLDEFQCLKCGSLASIPVTGKVYLYI